MSDINIPVPKLQIGFSFALGLFRKKYLKEALSATLNDINLNKVNQQLTKYVPAVELKELAKNGLRGELVFPVPCMLEANPFLLGYYHLLLGFSQKAFYTAEFGITNFKSMEMKGILTPKNKIILPNLCKSMISSACALIDGIGADRLSKDLLDELALLTVGPQLRGGANVQKGNDAIIAVFKAIHTIVEHAATESTSSKIQIKNAAGRNVAIEFSPDPDIVILEEMSARSLRNIIAVEVKGGEDFSNIHNRIGEAEKSHQKAKAKGYVECWTVVNVDRIDMDMAKRESPSTNRFYRISDLKSGIGAEYEDFKERIISYTGITAR